MADNVDPRVAAARAKAEQARNRTESPEEREKRLAELKKQAQAKKAQMAQAKGGGEAPAEGGAAAAVATMPRAWKRAAHDQAAKDIAEARYQFPSEEHPEFRTFVNRPAPQMALETPGGQKILPDIVVMEWRIHRPVMIGEVETFESLDAEDVVEKWRSFAGLDDVSFYLYVPLQKAREVRELLKKEKIEVAGLRGWRYIHGYQTTFDLTDIPLHVPFWAALFHA